MGSSVRGQTVLVEAEQFADTGGWVRDSQFMDEMGSPYLLAHGLGLPVKDAATSVALPAAGAYRVWVRTRTGFGHGNRRAPGRFQVLINGHSLAADFGRQGRRVALAGRRGSRPSENLDGCPAPCMI